jgi:hypothetical protein
LDVARLITTSLTLEDLVGPASGADQLPNSEIHLSVASVPTKSLRGGSAELLNAYLDLLYSLRETEGLAVGTPVDVAAPATVSATWAFASILDARDLSDERPVRAAPVRAQPRTMLKEQMSQLDRAITFGGGISTFSAPAYSTYLTLLDAPLYAVQNSPIKFVSAAAQAATAASPGLLTAANDGSAAAMIAMSAGGIFVTYVVVPPLRGLGHGLEEVVKQWVLRRLSPSSSPNEDD